MPNLREIASFARWRLVPVRYATMLANANLSDLMQRSAPAKSHVSNTLNETGHHPGPTMDAQTLSRIREIYQPRAADVQPTASGHPFKNLFRPEDISADNPAFKFAFSPEVLDTACDYFGGRLIMDSIQVLYSFPTSGTLRESQKWHRDYADKKSFHCVAYLNDVLTVEDGPFAFVDRVVSKSIKSSGIIRRIEDDAFEIETKGTDVITFYGKAGESVLIDPAACYHYGSRCKNSRLALFVTFNTPLPFTHPIPVISENKEKILEQAAIVRPDLSHTFLKRLLRMK